MSRPQVPDALDNGRANTQPHDSMKKSLSPQSRRTPATLGLGLALACASVLAAQAQDYTDVKPYLVPVTTDYAIQPLLSVGDQLPNTSDASRTYQMVGIPDGLGAHRGRGNSTVLLMNHEFGPTVISQPNVGETRLRGAFVSRFILDRKARVLSGEVAYDKIVDESTGIVYPPADETNTTRGFGRFCSGDLVWKNAGFDRPIYFPGEEVGASDSFDTKGGLAFALFDREIHSLPKLGRFPWENTLVRPVPGAQTVIMLMEDGPAGPESQLSMYVGTKSKAKNASVLSRNGLDTGKFYAFRSTTPGQTTEVNYQSGSITGQWVEIPGVENLTDVQLEAALDAQGAFGFIRTEDGAWSKTDKNLFYFVTTGGSPGNVLGRGYELKLNPSDVLGPCTLNVIYNGDTIDAAGGDIAFSPDNVDTSKRYLMIQEDGTSSTRPKMAERARDGSIWRLDLRNGFAPKRVAELNPPGTGRGPAVPPSNVRPLPPPVGPGVWESSGIIDSSEFYGDDSWITIVQAHGPSLAPAVGTVEDGQLLLMLPTNVRINGSDEDDDD